MERSGEERRTIRTQDRLILAGYLLTMQAHTTKDPFPVFNVADLALICSTFSEEKYGKNPFLRKGQVLVQLVPDTHTIASKLYDARRSALHTCIERMPRSTSHHGGCMRLTPKGMILGKRLAQVFGLEAGSTEEITPPVQKLTCIVKKIGRRPRSSNAQRQASEKHLASDGKKLSVDDLKRILSKIPSLDTWESRALLQIVRHPVVQQPTGFIDAVGLECTLRSSVDGLIINGAHTREEKLARLFDKALEMNQPIADLEATLFRRLLRTARTSTFLFPHTPSN